MNCVKAPELLFLLQKFSQNFMRNEIRYNWIIHYIKINKLWKRIYFIYMKMLYMFTPHPDTHYFVGDEKKKFPHFIPYWNYEWEKKLCINIIMRKQVFRQDKHYPPQNTCKCSPSIMYFLVNEIDLDVWLRLETLTLLNITNTFSGLAELRSEHKDCFM